MCADAMERHRTIGIFIGLGYQESVGCFKDGGAASGVNSSVPAHEFRANSGDGPNSEDPDACSS